MMKKKYKSDLFVANFKKAEENKFFMLVSRKLGKAVFRNKCKRRMRNALQHVLKEFKSKDYNIKTGFYSFFLISKIHDADFNYLKEQIASSLSFLSFNN